MVQLLFNRSEANEKILNFKTKQSDKETNELKNQLLQTHHALQVSK